MTRNTYSRRFRSRQKALEQRFGPLINIEIRKQLIGFLNSIRKNGYEYSKSRIDSIVRFDGVLKVIKQLYKYAVWIESNYVFSSLSGGLEVKRLGGPASFGVGFEGLGELVDEYFRIYQFNKSAVPISETTKAYIRNNLLAKVDSGVPLDQAIKEFRELALTSGDNAVYSRMRARMIVQTESTRAMNFGGLIGAYMTGIDLDKVWVTSHDEIVRGVRNRVQFPHTRLDRQQTEMMGSFYNGEKIKFPGDPEASPGNTVNCRCTVYFKEKSKKRFTRSITQFLTDFFTGFLLGNLLGELIENEA